MIDSYKSIKTATKGSYTEKGSKFLAFSFPVISEDEVKQHLLNLRKEHYNAKHYVYAFIIGPDGNFYRASDDGEPPNSSGQPVLNQIRSFDLSDVLVVVVRYFGGTKLGVSGLINAYKTAAYNALSKAEIIEKYITEKIQIITDYENINFVMRIIKDYDANILKQEFLENCKIEFEIKLSLVDVISNRLISNHKIIFQKMSNG